MTSHEESSFSPELTYPKSDPMPGLAPKGKMASAHALPTHAPDALELSVVIPAHNEEHGAASTIERVRATLEKLHVRYEVIVVDDGSTDGTRTVAERAGARVIVSAKNRGYGSALKRGIAATHSEFIAILDADGTYPPEVLPHFLELAKSADMIVGDRSAAMKNVPFVRRPAKWVLNKLANFLVQTNIPDLNSGLRVFKRDSLERFIPLMPDGFSFTTTITLCMLSSNMDVTYVPIDYGKRVGHSKIRAVDFFNFVMLVLRIVMLFQPLRIFMPLGTVLFLLGVAKTIYDVTLMNLSESAIFFLLAALIIWAMGLIADMISRLHLRP
jgi:glycosyltransferase involved in cell wall biosynthesis